MNGSSRRFRRLGGVVICVLILSCRSANETNPAVRSAPASASAKALAVPVMKDLERLRDAELRRDFGKIGENDLSHVDARVRIRAARALARIGQDASFPLLSRAIHDEDPTVVAWAAFGLGTLCKGRAATVIPTLVSRAASLAVAPPPAKPGALDPWFALTDALARCGSPEAERVLRSWLLPGLPAPRWAALALGRLATRAGRLDDETLVALADAASRASEPLSEALYPFSRLRSLEPSLAQRVLDVAASMPKSGADGRSYVIRALGRVGASAAPALRAAAEDPALDAATRATAVRELRGLGATATPHLEALLTGFDLREPSDSWLREDWIVFESVLGAMEPPVAVSAKKLVEIAGLGVPDAPPAVRRRAVWARCRAASVLAGTASLSERLLACDPEDGGRQGALARLSVLGRKPLAGDRLVRWREYVGAKDPIVRQQALRMIAAHPEVSDAAPILADALRSAQLGTVAAAAETLTMHPVRGAAAPVEPGAIRPHPAVADALRAGLDAAWPPDATETVGALAEAAGAMQLLGVKSRLEVMCKTASPGLRERLGRALELLGGPSAPCESPTPGGALMPPVWGVGGQVTIEFLTDLGPLRIALDADLAPAATRRIVDLVHKGFYSGVTVHRMIPGFLVQFGDPGGDGYGGAGLPPLPSESTPMPFQGGAVGVALSGRDSGSSQLFVTFGSFPHLDGDYPLIGRAGSGWDRLVLGDTIQSARVVE